MWLKWGVRFNWAIEDELRARNIEIPFPQHDLHIRSSVAVPVARQLDMPRSSNEPPSA